MVRRRHRKAFGYSEQTHSRLARDYLQRAKNDFAHAQSEPDCRPTLAFLVGAHANLARAHEHAASANRELPAADTLRKKLAQAFEAFGEGPCMRRTPYDK
jgi:hypothetical protein